MENILIEMNWYALPIGLQKSFRLITENMQNPIYYHGFGVIKLDLQTFAKVKFNQAQKS